ncbi:GNAT family N-acetyltransferase [Priestia flexa]|uniref:GNAT family N-acetyltransferase n=1 Tax=Priestia flexa TaxID=86664 RepID=UPI0032F00648
MNGVPIIQGEKVILRQPIDRDVDDYLQIETHPDLVRMYGGTSSDIKPKTRERALKFVEAIRKNKLEWCVEHNGRFVGQARLVMNEHDNRARYAVGLFDPSVWNQGLGTEITRLILQYAFHELKLHRIDLRVLAFNKRAIACYQKCGFVQEGVEREGVLINGVYETDIIMSILDREFAGSLL